MELVGKALYALAALIRNSHDGQAQFFATDGVEIVTEMLSRHDAASILRKTLNLLHDIVDSGGYVEVRKLSQNVPTLLRVWRVGSILHRIAFYTNQGNDINICL